MDKLFDFVPNLLIISSGTTATGYIYPPSYIGMFLDISACIDAFERTGKIRAMVASPNDGYGETNILLQNGNKTINWYTTKNSLIQLNDVSYTYSYVAIG